LLRLLGDFVPQIPGPASHHVNPLHSEILGMPMVGEQVGKRGKYGREEGKWGFLPLDLGM